MTLGSGATMGRKRTMANSNSHRPAPSGPAPACRARSFSESGNQLEKLEFSLAVAITRGDGARINQLRDQIAALGGNREEPGT